MCPINLSIATRALLAQQVAIETISHNIANVNTPGYTRQEAELVTTEDGAVRVRSVKRYVDTFISGQIRRNAGLLGESQVRHEAMQYVQSVLQEPSDQGLNSTLNQFWSAWQDLAASPESAAVRTNLREVSRRLANQFNTTAGQVTSLRHDLDYKVTTQVQEVNSLANQIAKLNESISKATIYNSQANDLRDQRDMLLDSLSKLVNINYAEDTYGPGMMTVNIGNQALVVGTDVRTLALQPTGQNQHDVVWADDGRTVELNNGGLRGTLQVRDQLLPDQLAQLDQIAASLISQINTRHQAGYGLNNSHQEDFFSGTGASDIRISDAVNADVSNIAAASAADSPGDASVALAIGDLQQALIMNGGTATINAFYQEFIAQIGLQAREADASYRERDLLVEHLTSRRSEASGVSLDEEAVQLMEHQRAYQAAARLVTVMDELMANVILNMGA